MNVRRLEKSSTDKVIAGVAGGLGEYLNVDPVVVRIAWVVHCFITFGVALILYIAMAIIMPGQRTPIAERGAPVAEYDEYQVEDGDESAMTLNARRDRRRNAVAIGLIVIGGFALASNFGLLSFLNWSLLWPVVIIALGGFLLLARTRGR